MVRESTGAIYQRPGGAPVDETGGGAMADPQGTETEIGGARDPGPTWRVLSPIQVRGATVWSEYVTTVPAVGHWQEVALVRCYETPAAEGRSWLEAIPT